MFKHKKAGEDEHQNNKLSECHRFGAVIRAWYRGTVFSPPRAPYPLINTKPAIYDCLTGLIPSRHCSLSDLSKFYGLFRPASKESGP